MKFCPNCGAKLDNDNFKFCPECGYNFESNASNSNTQGSGGLISSFIKGIRNEVQDNETLDDMVTHAKIIWHGPQTEKEKAYKERKRQEEEKKDPVKYKISEVTGKHLSDSPYFMERKKLFNVSDGYTYYKDILKWEVKNNALEYDDIEARLDELLKINDARTIFELRIKRPTYLFKTREDLVQYIGYGTAKNPIPIADEEIEKLTEKGFDRSAALKKILSEGKHEKKYGSQGEEIPVKIKVDNNINQKTEKPKQIPATTKEKEISTKQKIDELDYSKLELSDLQKTLIKTLPIINNPSEYEENIITKYAEYNSDERKELLKDCWTVTKLANEHNIKRHEVEKTILTDEFLNKDLIGVFKVNPNNIRSLKILYRKPLVEQQQKQETKLSNNEEIIEEVKEIPKELVSNESLGEETKVKPIDDIRAENSIIYNEVVSEEIETVVDGIVEEDIIEDEIIEQPQPTEKEQVEVSVEKKVESPQEKTINTSVKASKKNKKIYKKTKTQGKKRGLFSRKSPELKEFEKELVYYLGALGDSDYLIKRKNELNVHGWPNGNLKTILTDEFENDNLSKDNIPIRIDELLLLDNLSLIKYMLREGYDTSVIKTQEDLYEFLKEKYDLTTANKSNLKIQLKLLGIWGFGKNSHIEDILMRELEEGKLSLDNVENRIEELNDVDIDTLKMKVFDKDYDTSVIKTQEDLYEFLKEHYDIQVAEDSNKKRYRKERLFEKYGIDPNEAYCFECIIEERRSSTFSNTDRRNVDNAYVALYDDYIVIIKESVWLKSDMGMRKVYFNNVTSIDYDTAGKLGMSSSLFIHMHSGEHVQLKHVSKERVDEVHKRFENFTNKNSSENNVTITQETSNADELLKYAELYKQGLLTEEEFEAKKKELL